ncbi:membrane associated rhomboid family serine protease [Breoghania corrubedonensis]|uniref:Membrane associated rhomboid family serine protease n=1 Tax=Breoghania corrubedonensis TaxID=665038 RepID=A0A2T5VD02_9HYPH|nr:rhomboid family intramembrane serine protease [Breoghania corrubedonensis]PTW61647.1 membrane associated rhomboid family serine protease [Breoghania corrubedonensis]
MQDPQDPRDPDTGPDIGSQSDQGGGGENEYGQWTGHPTGPGYRRPRGNEPLFNLPGVVVGLIAVLTGIHLLRVLVFSPDTDFRFLLEFSFLPLRYASPEVLSQALGGASLPGGEGAQVWTFLTYAFLHGSFTHLAFNALWLAVFGSALARRFGAWRFLAFSAVTAVAGAAAHLATHFGEAMPVVGASAAISGHMAAVARFAFDHGGPLGMMRGQHPSAYRQPATSLAKSLSNRQVLAFLGVWFAVNLIFGMGSLSFGGNSPTIAWEAHIGGFLAGLALFSLFDPVPRRT